MGITSRIIHSGRFLELRNALSTFRRLAIFFLLTSELASRSSFRSSSESFSTSMWPNSSRMASAPMFALNSLPYSSTALR